MHGLGAQVWILAAQDAFSSERGQCGHGPLNYIPRFNCSSYAEQTWLSVSKTVATTALFLCRQIVHHEHRGATRSCQQLLGGRQACPRQWRGAENRVVCMTIWRRPCDQERRLCAYMVLLIQLSVAHCVSKSAEFTHLGQTAGEINIGSWLVPILLRISQLRYQYIKRSNE